jgi:hypothetical protein
MTLMTKYVFATKGTPTCLFEPKYSITWKVHFKNEWILDTSTFDTIYSKRKYVA